MKVIILKKKSLIAGALIICFAAVFIAAVTRLIPAAAEATAAQSRKLPIYSVEKNEKVVSLTFDAAWGNVILVTSYQLLFQVFLFTYQFALLLKYYQSFFFVNTSVYIFVLIQYGICSYLSYVINYVCHLFCLTF